MADVFNFDAMPRLETERMVLREFDAYADTDALFALYADTEVAHFTDTGPFTDRSEAVEVASWIQEIFDERVGLRWAVALKSDESALIGTAGFNHWDRDNSLAEIGYDLVRDQWGRGLMTEALRSVVGFGFESMALNRIEADVTVGNAASAAVLEKLGFEREGLLRQRSFWKGSHHDLWFYSLLRSDDRL